MKEKTHLGLGRPEHAVLLLEDAAGALKELHALLGDPASHGGQKEATDSVHVWREHTLTHKYTHMHIHYCLCCVKSSRLNVCMVIRGGKMCRFVDALRYSLE